MLNHLVKVSGWVIRFLQRAHKFIEAAESLRLVRIAQLGGLKGTSQHPKRLIIGFQRNRKWMAIFSAVSERKSRRIRKSYWGSMDNFRDQG